MPGWTFKSSDEERRKLRCHIATLQNALTAQKKARQRMDDENRELRNQIKHLQEETTKLKEEKEEAIRQRDVYKGMVFKANIPKEDRNEIDEDTKEIIDRLKNKKKKKRGRKKGHAWSGRKKPEKIDKTQRVYLSKCPDCGGALNRSDKINSHTVEDIPSLENIQTIVTEYEIEEQWCPCCKKHVRAQPAEVVPNSRFGIYIMVLILFLKYGAKNSWPTISFILANFFRIKICPGALVKMAHRARSQLGEYYDKILIEIKKSSVKFADETHWRLEGINHWVWAFFNACHAYYVIEESRGKGVPENIFRDSSPNHVCVHDDYGAYQKLDFKHQSCWAHLLRVSHEWANLANASEEVKVLHERLSKMYDELSAIISTRFVKQDRLIKYEHYKKIIFEIINHDFKNKDTKKIQTRISNQNENLITAILYPDVPLTNNLSERGIRPFVITRKISGGSRSKEGAKTHAVNMSVFQTIHMQKLPILSTLKNYVLNISKN